MLAGQSNQAINGVGHSITTKEREKWFTGDVVAKSHDEIAVQNGYLAIPGCVVAEQVDEVELGIGWVLTRELVELFMILEVKVFELRERRDSVAHVSNRDAGEASAGNRRMLM